jgi:response regulator NasT
MQSLRNELKQAKTQLQGRKYIDRAKGLIMHQKNISEDEAYKQLRKMAMDQSTSLADVAKNIIDVCELLAHQ